jgi:protein-S-isoprenylcysteine O-methyltransferase Ste14
VVDGLYRFTRNPMYLGMLCILLGFAIRFGNLMGLLAVAAFVASITITQIKPEERALGLIFGDAYRDYCRRVRRWI